MPSLSEQGQLFCYYVAAGRVNFYAHMSVLNGDGINKVSHACALYNWP